MSGVSHNSTTNKPYSANNPPPASAADQLDASGTTLDIGAVADGEYFRRSGTNVVGDTPSGGGGSSLNFHGVLTDSGDFATLDASSISAGTRIDTLGYASAGDNGAGRYEIRATSVTADNFLVFDTATAGKQAHLLLKRPNRFLMAQAGVDLTGATNSDAAIQRLFDASSASKMTKWDGQGGTVLTTHYGLTINKKIDIRNCTFQGPGGTDTAKGQQYLFKLYSDFRMKGVEFHDYGAAINGGSLSVVGSSDDNVVIKAKRCHFEDCNFAFDFLGGGSGDGTDGNANTIKKIDFQDITCDRVIRAWHTRIKKYDDIYVRNFHVRDSNDDENFLSADPILSANHTVFRIGQDHGGTSADDEFFKTVKSAVFINVTIDGVTTDSDRQVYGINNYIYGVRYDKLSISNVTQEDTASTGSNTRPVTGIYFRGRNWTCTNGYFKNCSNGNDNGMLHVKSAGINGSAINNHFEITQDYYDIDSSITPIGISAEKAGIYNENTFTNVYEMIRAQDEQGVDRSYDVSHNIGRVTLAAVVDCRIKLGGKASITCSYNQFPNGGSIVQDLTTTDDMKICRILHNKLISRSSDHVSSTIDVQRHPSELQEISDNILIQEFEVSSNRITVRDGSTDAVLVINRNHIRHPSDVGTWADFFDGIRVFSGVSGKLCQMYDNRVINVKGRGISYSGAHGLCDIENPHIEGATSDPIRFDGATPTETRIVSRSGQFRTMNKGTVSVSGATTTVTHGVDAVDLEGRNAIIAGEVQIRSIGDSNPVTRIWTENFTATQFDIRTDAAPTTPFDVVWIAARTDQFE